jgi:hypothetical protein
MAKPETKFWQYWKKNTPNIIWTRLENMSSFGTPDLLGYNKNKFFFTVELKVTNTNKVRLSPHQIAFHIRHPENTFILVKTKLACRLYLGKQVKELLACGCSLEPVACGLNDCRLWLEDLGGDDTLSYP